MAAGKRDQVEARFRQEQIAAMVRKPRARASWRQIAGLAWRESRTARRRLLLYMSSISLGVAALVAIDSFAANVTSSVRGQSRALLGGDISFSSRTPFAAPVDSLLDSLSRAGTPVARVTTFASMGVVPRTEGTRLVQVRAVTPGYPFYGEVTTEPEGRWRTLQAGANALVDPSLLIALDARVGDTLTLGYGRFVIAGTLRNVPGDPGVAAVIGPRVFIPARYLPETQLLVFGSRAEYEALVRLPPTVNPAEWVAPFRPRFERARVRVRTVVENEMNLTRSIDQLGDFLGIVGLIALLLGGIGVASGIHAFVTKKIDTVAVLRCLGATSGQVLAIYAAQAVAMGLIGAAAGALLGVAIQFTLPRAVGEFLPVDVQVRPDPAAIVTGLLVGACVALAFALRPLIALRNVSPLQALRRDADTAVRRTPWRQLWRDWPRLLVNAALVASVVAIAVSRSQSFVEGLWLSAGIAAVLVVLWASATLLSYVARRLLRSGWPYVVRQGVANLYRPANQTRAVVLSLGFGAFLVSTLYLVQTNLLRQFSLTADASSGNLLFFDVQDDQAATVDSLVRASGHRVTQRTPIVNMRIAEINGWRMAALTDTTDPDGVRRSSWALRREYRSTYRDTLVASEKVTAGRWLGAGSRSPGDTLPQVSMEQDVAKELGLRVGDVVTWDVQGVRVPTRVGSFREVNWARFEPNFFAVFSPAALEAAPKQFVILAEVDGSNAIARLQREVVRRHPNVSSIDLSLILRTLSGILDRVRVAVRFMAVFSLVMGLPVLFTAVAATRRERVREGVLLKTLGATRGQIGRIMLAEYSLLGFLGALTGMVLSFGGAWALMRYVFEGPFAPAWGPALAIAALMVALTLAIGLLTGRDVFRETPMAALREA
jgi:putative ABC transport system permease protein